MYIVVRLQKDLARFGQIIRVRFDQVIGTNPSFALAGENVIRELVNSVQNVQNRTVHCHGPNETKGINKRSNAPLFGCSWLCRTTSWSTNDEWFLRLSLRPVLVGGPTSHWGVVNEAKMAVADTSVSVAHANKRTVTIIRHIFIATARCNFNQAVTQRHNK